MKTRLSDRGYLDDYMIILLIVSFYLVLKGRVTMSNFWKNAY